MKNLVIDSVLAEEAQADLTLQAAREKAARLVKDAEADAAKRTEEAKESVRARLAGCTQEAQRLAEESEQTGATDITVARAILKTQTSGKLEAAAEAALKLLQ